MKILCIQLVLEYIERKVEERAAKILKDAEDAREEHADNSSANDSKYISFVKVIKYRFLRVQNMRFFEESNC